MKFCTQVLLFGNDKWIMKNIENAYPHVDKIYIAYSDTPWTYNPQAREIYSCKMDLSIIKNSSFIDKIEIIEGVWNTEEEQRNICLEKAKIDGMDYQIIHDADEFYSHNDFKKMIDWIKINSNYSIYRCSWLNFWKTKEYVTVKEDGDLIAGYPDIAINLNHNLKFTNKRTATKENIGIIDDIKCFHMSYVLTDEEVMKKLSTWGHHRDFNTQNWYENIWLKWNENSTGLHPIQPNAWYRAIKYTGEYPEFLR